MSEVRKGDWIKTWSGRQFWPMDPKVEDVNILDIAHSLSNLCRYGGHVNRFYSVAEHSIHIASRLQNEGYDKQIIKWALLHDATEAYCADVPRPLKNFLPDYMKIEEGISKVIIEKYNMLPDMPDIVKEYDDRITLNEMDILTNNESFPVREGNRLPIVSNKILNWKLTPVEIRSKFIWMCNELLIY